MRRLLSREAPLARSVQLSNQYTLPSHDWEHTLPRWRASGSLVELRAGELRFTPEVAAQFLV